MTPFAPLLGGEAEIESTFDTVFGNMEKMK